MSFVKTCLVVATFALLVGAGIRGASAQPDDEYDPTSAATEDDEGDRLPDADGDDDSEGEAAVAESTPTPTLTSDPPPPAPPMRPMRAAQKRKPCLTSSRATARTMSLWKTRSRCRRKASLPNDLHAGRLRPPFTLSVQPARSS